MPRKKRVHLTNEQKEEIRTKYVKAGGIDGTVPALAEEYNVHRKTIHGIIHPLSRLQKVTTKNKTILQKSETAQALLNTYEERIALIDVLKQSEILPITKKVKKNEILTPSDRVNLHTAINTLEKLFGGIDNLTKVDIHFHSTKILNVIENMDGEMAELLFPEIKKRLCYDCPAYKAYTKKMRL